jgi:gluconate 2-dehydrogenase gamma chain
MGTGTERNARADEWAEALVLSRSEWRTLEAIADAVVPGDPGDPGAVEAGAVPYIDRALSGAYEGLEPIYRVGLAQLEQLSLARYSASFRELERERRVSLLQELSLNFFGVEAAADISPELAEFAEQAREHVLEGLLADPLYGGNREMIGWRLIGFPGAQWGYSPEQRNFNFDAASLEPKSLSQLVAERESEAGR